MNRNLIMTAALTLSACKNDKEEVPNPSDQTQYIDCEAQESNFIESVRANLTGQEGNLTDAVYTVTNHVSIRADKIVRDATSTPYECASELDLHFREVETGIEAELNLGTNAVDVLSGSYHDWLTDYNSGKWVEGSNTEIRARFIEVGEQAFNRQMNNYFNATQKMTEDWVHASAHHALNAEGHTELDPTLCGVLDEVDPDNCPASDEVHAWTLAAGETMLIVEEEMREEVGEAIASIQ